MIPLEKQLIIFLLIISGIIIISKTIGIFIHEDWFYSGKISKDVLEKRKFDVIMKSNFYSSHQINGTISNISSNDLISKNTDLDIICMVKQMTGKAKEGKLEFYFSREVICKEPPKEKKRSMIDKLYAKFRIVAFRLHDKKKPYVSYRWDSESLLPSSFYEPCLTFKGISYLFSWENIPGNDNMILSHFLKSNYDVDWIKTAKIAKTDNLKTILITAGKKFISLNLNNENTELNLKIDNGKTDKFSVKTENGNLNIYKKSMISTLPSFSIVIMPKVLSLDTFSYRIKIIPVDPIPEKYTNSIKIFCSQSSFAMRSEEFPLINPEYYSDFLFNIPNLLNDEMFIDFKLEFTNKDYLLGDIVLKKIAGIGPLPPREFNSNNECNYYIKIKITNDSIKNLLKEDLLLGVNDSEAKEIAANMSKIFTTNNHIDAEYARIYLRNYFISIQEMCPIFLKKSMLKMIESFELSENNTNIYNKKILAEQDDKPKYDLKQSFIISDAFEKAPLLME